MTQNTTALSSCLFIFLYILVSSYCTVKLQLIAVNKLSHAEHRSCLCSAHSASGSTEGSQEFPALTAASGGSD